MDSIIVQMEVDHPDFITYLNRHLEYFNRLWGFLTHDRMYIEPIESGAIFIFSDEQALMSIMDLCKASIPDDDCKKSPDLSFMETFNSPMSRPAECRLKIISLSTPYLLNLVQHVFQALNEDTTCSIEDDTIHLKVPAGLVISRRIIQIIALKSEGLFQMDQPNPMQTMSHLQRK